MFKTVNCSNLQYFSPEIYWKNKKRLELRKGLEPSTY